MTGRRFDSLLVANRGEIAVRIVRAAKELGLRTVVAYSDADADSLAVRWADQAVRLGPAPASQSYLDIDQVLAAAARAQVGAIHPGYGFLAENAQFAAAVEAAGLVFVGPSPETIRRMGDKAVARGIAAAAGVPTVPGSESVLREPAEALQVAERIGYPVMIKAAAGGGGRGIRIAPDAKALATQLVAARAEAEAAFGDGGVYLERFVRNARHIEVQVLGDGVRVIHCFERECSLQRRRQKVWEEAPSPALDAAARSRLCAMAVRLAGQVGYRGAGTLEFLYDDDSGEFFFIEMNTRIQVEHPVTEMVTGLDLVQEMLRIALGEPLRLRQDEVRLQGAAIEVRLNAEDAARGFAPCPGRITQLRLPDGPGVRFDTWIWPGCEVSPYYDSLLGKLIVHAQDRPAALARLARSLDELEVDGLCTTAPLLRALCDAPEVRSAAFDTGFLERWLQAAPAIPAAPREPSGVAR